MADFERLGVCPEIIRAVEEDGWLLPTPVQDEAIPLILGGCDVCVAAETGSGKTGAFGLPCLQIVHETLQNKALTSASSARSGGSVPGFTFDINAKDSTVFVDESGLEARSQLEKWTGVKTTGDVLRGKYMFETEVLSSGLVRVGWAAAVSSFELGTDDRSFGYGGTGKMSWNKTFTTYGAPFGQGDIIGCLIDRQHETISFSKNGAFLGIAFPVAPSLHNVPLKPAVCGKNFHVRINTSSTMKYPVKDFVPIGSIDPSHTSFGLARELTFAGKGKRRPLCLILEPTRDLAQQTYNCMVNFGKYLDAPNIRVGLFVGGVDEKAQKEALQQGVDIAVGTLQKISFYVRRTDLDLSNVRFLVLDEADDLMRNDDKNDIPALKMRASSSYQGRLQTLFFSATLHSPEVRSAIEKITVNPTWVDLKGKPSIPDTVHFVCYKIDPTKTTLPFPTPTAMPLTDGVHARVSDQSPDGYSQRAKVFKPKVAVALADAFDMRTCLVFCRTNLDCNNFEKYLTSLGGGRAFSEKAESGKENPYSCVVLAGMRSQEERRKNLEYFKAGDVRFLVCTDLAARGIDIKELPFLMMLTLPDEPDQFFHRVGRVGRADHMGLAICIVSTEKEKVWYHTCANRGRGCSNTNLVDQRGCCIWYDEPAYLAAIEQRVGASIPEMNAVDFSVKGIIDPLRKADIAVPSNGQACGRRSQLQAASTSEALQYTGKMTVYGKAKGGPTDRLTLQHMRELAPSVEELKVIERCVQQKYVELLSKGIRGIQMQQ